MIATGPAQAPGGREAEGRAAGRALPWRRIAMWLALLAGTALGAKVLLGSSDELFAAADDLTDLRPGWIVAAFGAEALCYLARGAAQRHLLVSATRGAAAADGPDPGGTARGRRPHPGAGVVVLGATTLAGDAVAYCLPFGFAAAGVVTLRVLRRRGVGEVLAGWMFGVATALYVAVLAVLAVVAAQLAGDDGPAGLQAVSIGLLVVIAVALGGFVAARRVSWSRVPGSAVLARAVSRFRRAGDGGPAAAGTPRRGRWTALRGRLVAWWSELSRMRLTGLALLLAGIGMLVSWACDIGVLAASYAALGAVPPWSGLLLAYCAGQVVSSVPITPGGIGVVEGSLTLALVAFGGSTETTLAAVLVYRLISHWACVPAGGLAWLVLRRTSRRFAAPAATDAEVPDPRASAAATTPAAGT